MKRERTTQQKIAIILGLFLAMFLIPLLGEYLHSNGSIPADYFSFRPKTVPEKAPFNFTIFLIIAIAGAFGVSIYILPRLYGFKKTPKSQNPPPKDKVSLPAWFWVGLVMWATTGFVLWTKAAKPKLLIDFAVIPLFWGLAMVIDGIVYKRNGGSSIIKDRPKTMLAVGMASIGGWLLFEYLNFFVRYNWYYPENGLTRTSAFFLYAILGSAGLLPMTIEVYALLRTFKGLRERYSYGPKVRISRGVKYVLLIFSVLILFPVPFLPNQLFWIIWIAPLIVIVLALDMLGEWTPFTPISEKGDWAPFALICMAQFIVGICTECMNYFSGTHNPLVTNNPDYWVYSIPYVNAYHIFEMPALGLLGYVPFGIYFWAWFLLIAFLFDIPPYLGKNKSYIPD